MADHLLKWMDIRAVADFVLIAAVMYLLFRIPPRLGTWKAVAGLLPAMGLFALVCRRRGCICDGDGK